MAITAAFMLPHPPLILPEVGRGLERKIQKTIHGYQEAARRIGELRPETIVLISPHQAMYSDYFHLSPGREAKGDFGAFQANGTAIEVFYDREFTEFLCRLAAAEYFPAGTAGEQGRQLDHGTMIPLYFVNQYWTQYQLVRIGLSGLSFLEHYQLGQYIKAAAEGLNRNTVVIASGDLSHRLKEDGPYGFQEEGPAYDHCVMDVMGRAAFGELLEFSEIFCEKAGECGHRSFCILAGALDQTAVKCQLCSYEGPFGVGYGICAYQVVGEDKERDFRAKHEQRERARILGRREREDSYVRLARRTIETYLRTGERLPANPEHLPEDMTSLRAGVFVSIKEYGRLRGCMGTIQGMQPSIAEEIMANAVSAAVRDPRFSPIKEKELAYLTISVDVLGEPEPIVSAAQLDPKRYGVIVTNGQRRGLLLPNLEGVDTAEDQIMIARKKAGIRQDEEILLERFSVIRHT